MANSKYKFWAILSIFVLLSYISAAKAATSTKAPTTTTKTTTTKSNTSTSSTKPAKTGDRRTDATGLHKSSVEAATLHVYTKVDELRADPLLRQLLKSAPSSDSPNNPQNFDNERAGEANLDIAENLAASLIRQDKFDNTEQLTGFEKDCIVLGPKSHENIIDLSSGNALFAPGKNIVVMTNLGEIAIGAGSIVCILKPEPGMVAIYDLHDNGKKVIIKTKDEILTLTPGKQIILSNQSKAELEFEKVNPAHRIAYRKLEQRALSSGTKVYASEFSIPSAILYIKPLRTLLLSDNKEDRKLADHLLKNFVILEDVFGDGAEPYKMPRPLQVTRISANVK